jgi:hypothetical protein
MTSRLLMFAWMFAAFTASTRAHAQDNSAEPTELIKVVSASRDIAVGEVVTLNDLSERTLEAQWVTSSAVKVDSVKYIVNQKLTLPVAQGDILFWFFFETTKSTAIQRCDEITRLGRTGVDQIARARQVLLSRKQRK